VANYVKASIRGMPIGSIFIYPLTTPPAGAFLLNGQNISNCQTLYPDFWSWLQNAVMAGSVRTLSNTDYESEITLYGQCGAFVISGSDVRLPLINGFIQGLGRGTDKGATVAPGLPDHDHSYKDTVANHPASVPTYGANNQAGSTANSTPTKTTSLASAYNSIYGNSDTVQPPAIKYNYCIQVFNAATELSQQQSAQIATTLQGKADVNLGNLSAHTAIDANCPVDYIIKRWSGTSSWYRIWKSGWVEQGGQCAGTSASAHNTVTITFLVAFANTKYVGFKNYNASGTSTPVVGHVSIYDKTTTSAKTYTYGTQERDWYVCGIGLSDPTGTDPLSI